MEDNRQENGTNSAVISTCIPKYSELEYSILDSEVELWIIRIESFLKSAGYSQTVEKYICIRALMEIISRVHKREQYFEYFHDGMKINTYKQVALYAYWILKFHPVTITDALYIDNGVACHVNEHFAIHTICTILAGCKKIKEQVFAETSYYKKLLYAFRNRNISIDAFLLVVESMSDETFNHKHDQIQ